MKNISSSSGSNISFMVAICLSAAIMSCLLQGCWCHPPSAAQYPGKVNNNQQARSLTRETSTSPGNDMIAARRTDQSR